jgi:curved DNA-binding protein CbpA
MSDDHFSILGINEFTSATDLKTAYRREMSIWHPDRFHGDPENYAKATEHAKKINAAYEYISELHESGALPQKSHEARGGGYSNSHGSARSYQQEYRTKHTYRKQGFQPGFPDPNIIEIFLKSSNIVSSGYNRELHLLYIKFAGGAVYIYDGVPEHVYNSFLSADSHGKFAHAYIYKHYRYHRCA